MTSPEFSAYERGLIMFGVAADIAVHDGMRPWVESFTREVLDILTDSDEKIIADTTGGELPGDPPDDDEPDVDSLREGMIERFVDDVICALPDGYDVDTASATGAPVVIHSPH